MPRGRPDAITESFLEAVVGRLREDKPVRRALPVWGRIHIDRPLPFLLVYRRPRDRHDSGTERLVLGEASYLLAPGARHLADGLSTLVQRVAEACLLEFDAFLLVEVWSQPEEETQPKAEALERPGFRIVHRGSPALAPTIERFVAALRKVRIRRLSAEVETVVERRIRPAGSKPLLSEEAMSASGLYVMGLEVRPIYRATPEKAFPLVLRELHREVSNSVKRALVAFVRTRTAYQPTHYKALGRRAVVKAVWEVDRILAEVSDAFEFLLSVTPLNARQAWSSFERNGGEKAPRFGYRPLPLTPTELKRKLFAAPLERIEDPELSWIFRQKQYELDRQLTALFDRDTSRFLYGSLQLYGNVDEGLHTTALELLSSISPYSREPRSPQRINAAAFAARARDEIEYFKTQHEGAVAEVEITSKVTGLMVSRGKLLIAADLSIPSSRLEPLIQHEVGTHVLTHINGRAQPFRLLSAGLAQYDELQEGLAVLSEYLVNGLSAPRLRLLAARVVAVKSMIDGASFVETFRMLDRNYEFSKQTAFSITMRVFRGGGLTKDASYLRGLVRLLAYIREGGRIEPLLVGKLGVDDIPVVNELLYRKVLRPPPLRPRYFEDPAALARLERLVEKKTLRELLASTKKRRRSL